MHVIDHKLVGMTIDKDIQNINRPTKSELRYKEMYESAKTVQKEDFGKLCIAKKEETIPERIHIVSVVCSYQVSANANAESFRNRLRGTRSGISCVPGETSVKDVDTSFEKPYCER